MEPFDRVRHRLFKRGAGEACGSVDESVLGTSLGQFGRWRHGLGGSPHPRGTATPGVGGVPPGRGSSGVPRGTACRWPKCKSPRAIHPPWPWSRNWGFSKSTAAGCSARACRCGCWPGSPTRAHASTRHESIPGSRFGGLQKQRGKARDKPRAFPPDFDVRPLGRSLRLRGFRSGGSRSSVSRSRGAGSVDGAGAGAAQPEPGAGSVEAGAGSVDSRSRFSGSRAAGAASAGAASAGATSAGANSQSVDGDGDGAGVLGCSTSHHKETNGQNHQQQTQTLHRITLSQKNRSFRDACVTQPRDTHFSPRHRSVRHRFYSRPPKKASSRVPLAILGPKWGIIGQRMDL